MTAGDAQAATPGQAAQAAESPNKPRPDDALARSVADMLRRVEVNYDREGSGPGSRFEGQLLEDVQARAVIKAVVEAAELTWDEDLRRERDEARAEAASLRGHLAERQAAAKRYAGQRDTARDAITALSGELRDMTGERDAARAGMAGLRSRLDGLAGHWNREYASETGWPSRCAAELREELAGGGGVPDDGEVPGDEEIAGFARDAEGLRDE